MAGMLLYFLSQSIGVPPSLSSLDHLTTITRMASDESIPRKLAALAEIQACAAKYTSLVSESAEFHLAAILERTCKHELNLIEDRYADHWDSDIKFVVLDSKLHLIATLVISQDKQLGSANEGTPATPVDASLLAMLFDGFTCATQMVQIMCNNQEAPEVSEPLRKYAIPSNELYMQCLPKLYFRALMFAAFYLLRYHAPQSAIPVADGNIAQNHVDMACNYLRRYSVRPDDEPGRAAAVIETLSTFSAALPHASVGPMRIKERFGASIYYDALTRANELRAKPVRLFSDREQPQQTLVVETSPENADGIGSSITNTRESSDETVPEDIGYLANLPDDWMEHIDLDMMELSGDLFTGATMFS
ncbi:Fc.00g026280.m01.CDS01 [Cosmosporella sp. VM-42]